VAITMRYRAFISYSHRDSGAATWLHRKLESYRLPRALRGPSVPERLTPVFRDRDELASASVLSESIQKALDDSAALIVVCSPAAVASRWVNEEIRYFRSNHPERKVLAFIVDGDPGASPLRNPAHACFPSALVLRDPSAPDGETIEPAAPDARKEADGRTPAFLKLAAGLLDVPYDKLRQRETRRQQQRWSLVAAGSLSLSVIMAFLTWQAMTARDAAREAQGRAELEADSARQTSDFVVSLFEVSDPGEARGNSITAREVLDRGVERIAAAEFAKPVVKSRLLGTMGRVYAGLGLLPRARELLGQSESLVITPGESSEEGVQRTDAQLELADLLYNMGEYGDAREALGRIELSDAETPQNVLRRARFDNVRGDIAFQTGDEAAAKAAYESALKNLDSPGGDNPDQRARSLVGLGQIHLYAEKYDEAKLEFGQAYERLRALHGADHPHTLWALDYLAASDYRSGDSARAEARWTEALSIGRRILGDGHPEVATFLNNVALIRLEACRFAEAEPMLRESLKIDRQARDGFDDLVYTLNSLALARMGKGAPDEAESLLLEARDIAVGTKHRMLGPVLNNLADLYCSTGRVEEAQSLIGQSRSASLKEYGAEHWRSKQALITAAYCGSKDPESVSNKALTAGLGSITNRWGERSLYAQRALQQLAWYYLSKGEAARASAALSRVSKSMKAWQTPQKPAASQASRGPD
jgi:tetratricopeptide (TPR) repeat protein